MNKEFYDKDYYEDGVCSGKSCYVNYRWIPELTIKMAYHIVRGLGLRESDTVLDYGCAKGYLVKALRVLDIDAYGCDISEYAIFHADIDVREYCYLVTQEKIKFKHHYDWIITKDVLEHMRLNDIEDFLSEAHKSCRKMFHVIPLGNNHGEFIIPEYHDDPSHIQVHSIEWWIEIFRAHGWETTSFSHDFTGVKENWTSKYPDGNGFFVLEKVL